MPRYCIQTVDGNVIFKSNHLRIIGGGSVTLAANQMPNGDIILTVSAASGSGTPSATVEAETSFGISAGAGASSDYSRGDHTHGSPTNPVTAHEAAGDPHPGYLTAAEGNALYLLLSAFDGLSKITVSASAPGSHSTGDLWVDTS